MFAHRRFSLVAVLFALSAVTAFATYLEGVLLRGRLAEEKCFYAPGETMTFELKLDRVKELPEGCTIHWDRWGDDGQTTNGSIAATAADVTYKVETSLAVPGFVWLKATLRRPDGAIVSCASNGNYRVVQFDGGAGVEPQKLQSVPEPEDFDAFWAAQRKLLDSVPITVEKKELASPHPDQFKLFAVSIACPGPRPVTGYLVVPADFGSGEKYSARISFQGYGTGVQHPPTKRVQFHLAVHQRPRLRTRPRASLLRGILQGHPDGEVLLCLQSRGEQGSEHRLLPLDGAPGDARAPVPEEHSGVERERADGSRRKPGRVADDLGSGT